MSQNNLSYDEISRRFEEQKARESAAGIDATHQSRLFLHDTAMHYVVVLFHGFTASPNQYEAFARQLFRAGYDVYVPLAPHHGTGNRYDLSDITIEELKEYANAAVAFAAHFGNEIGLIGLSGGGAIATWAAEYCSEVSKLLLLSPFYEPAASQAPKWQLPFLKFLYGKHILPDKFKTRDGSFSFRALANYLRLVDDLKNLPLLPHLKSIAVVTTAADDQVDLNRAVAIPALIATTNQLSLLTRELPQELGIDHAIVDPSANNVTQNQDWLYQLFQDFYEGHQS